jgi:hypothetical protein
MYLNRWTPYFNPKNEIHSTFLVWVQLPHLPLHCRNEETLRCIVKILGIYIDKTIVKEGIFFVPGFV